MDERDVLIFIKETLRATQLSQRKKNSSGDDVSKIRRAYVFVVSEHSLDQLVDLVLSVSMSSLVVVRVSL